MTTMFFLHLRLLCELQLR